MTVPPREPNKMFSRIEQNPLFDTHRKTLLHVTYFVLVVVAIILTFIRIGNIKGTTTRSDTLAIVMGIKSIIVLAYQTVTTRFERYRKWASLKAYMILNCMEILFWFVVVIISLMGISAQCSGVACGLGVIVLLVALVLVFLAVWVALISILDFRYYRTYGTKREDPKIPTSEYN